jgi:RNA polymerase sigma-70 factor (ECF subfamily)
MWDWSTPQGLRSTGGGGGGTGLQSAGPVESFEQYYRRDYRSLLGLAYVLTGSQPLAEDLVQDALMEASRRWEDIARYDKPGAWVRRVLVNKNTSRLRRLRSETRSLLALGSRATPTILPTERSGEVWAAVRELPARQAQVIALYYWDDLPIADISLVLELSPETVKTHLKRGRSALAGSLASFRMDAE